LRRPPSRLLSVPENNIAEVKQKPFTPPTVSPTELTTYIGTPPQTASELPQYPLPFHPQHTHPETFAKFVNATYTIKNDLITRKTLAKRPPQS
ncbi:hypothetical protein, partial [Corynebacterium diphtheriae]|uniref:hypothetical protein n=1 Tax=Corynebacterium diphtheriae TaxID=1717 RepID=UPI001A7E0671